MSINDQDTDPPSPESRRSPRAATTDPGVGPPSAPNSGRASCVVVPPVSRTPAPPAAQLRRGGAPVTASTPTGDRAKDSVELRLEGMSGPRPDRAKTTPRPGGGGAPADPPAPPPHAGRTPRPQERPVLV